MTSEIQADAGAGPTITSSGTNSDGSRLIPAKTIQGLTVYGQSGAMLGVIADAILDPVTARVIYYVIDLEGADADPHPVPVARLNYDHSRGSYITDLSKEQIESAPPQHDRWYEDEAWQQRSHEHFDVAPNRPQTP